MAYKISIVTPVYNAAKTLSRAFASLQAQTIGFSSLEILLVDDCSTDESWEIVQAFAKDKPNVVAIRTENNTGSAGVPRNIALQRATAPYLMFLDNDDAFTPDACAVLLAEAEASGADLVTGYYRNVDENGTPLDDRTPNCTVHAARKEYHFPQDYGEIYEVRQGGWCKIYKTSIIRENNLQFASECYMEDILFIAQFLLASRSMVYIDHLVYDYTERESSLTHIRSTKYLLRHARSYWQLWEIFSGAGQPACFDQEFYSQADFYVDQIFSSPYVATAEERLALLQAWQPLVRLTLERNLYIADETERALFEQIAAGEWQTVAEKFPLYLLQRTLTELRRMQREFENLNDAYKRQDAAYKSLAEDRDRVQAKLNKMPAYRVGKLCKKLLKK